MQVVGMEPLLIVKTAQALMVPTWSPWLASPPAVFDHVWQVSYSHINLFYIAFQSGPLAALVDYCDAISAG